ncbi:MAG: ABC transporter ATP-binding protein [Candidatus Omnitrophica bacterium]|nr:ABC transporter ATP-binding protein [Candidatus Omnitrophota bacterium]
MTDNNAISIHNLVKYYRNRFLALKNISFEVNEGEFFGFLGPNGAGKTTTINILTGLANFNEGTVRVFGHDVMKDYRETRKLIGLVPQEFNFDPYLSIEQILIYEGGYFGIPRKTCRDRARALLNEFGLYEKRNQDYRRLSGGMKRRLLIARALIHEPKILILDEPTAGVDLELRHRLWQFFRDLNARGRTIFLTTHYIEEAERLCSTIGVIHRGQIVAFNEKNRLIREISGHWVVVELRQPLKALSEELTRFGVTLGREGKVLRFQEQAGVTPGVMKEIHRLGLEIARLDVRKATLEDTFIKLTGFKDSFEGDLDSMRMAADEE